ncbi:uncharacterized protein C6orf136 homolog isoform 2-T5 [Menidia menidia]
MAVSRGGVALWVGCSRRPSVLKCRWSLSQVVDCRPLGPPRPLSSASWALAPPNSLRYQSMRQPLLSHPLHADSQPQRGGCCEEDWAEALGLYVLVPPTECTELHTLQEVPTFSPRRPEPPAPGAARAPDFSFPLTTVDGRREDDISVQSVQRSRQREAGCFRSLFEAEGCPAPFLYGSRFYCFHCPDTRPRPQGPPPQDTGLNGGLPVGGLPVGGLPVGGLPVEPCVPLYSHPDGAEVEHWDGDSQEEQKLALMYERLRIELPAFFMSNHDYSMYSHDMEFINGLLNMKTRGRALYRLSLSLWRLLCLCYYAEARLDVLKLTKHLEDGSIKARWRIRGLPFHTLLLRFYRKDKSHLYRTGWTHPLSQS